MIAAGVVFAIVFLAVVALGLRWILLTEPGHPDRFVHFVTRGSRAPRAEEKQQ